MIKKLLIIGDPHAHPDYDNSRFDLLGKYIVESQPDCIICMGDFADMPSLSSYDRGTTGFEGRRYSKDVAAAVDAQRRMWAPTEAYNAHAAKMHRKRYDPDTAIVYGNHEDRIDKARSSNPHLSDTLSLADLRYEEFWGTVVDFKTPMILENIVFRHFHPNRMGRATSSVSLARTIMTKSGMSCVVGHSHLLDFAQNARADGRKRFGLSAGCFGHPDHDESWSRGTDGDWWIGVIELENVEDGYFERLTTVSLEWMERNL